MITSGDSNESEESIGDMPIELRYLEGDFLIDPPSWIGEVPHYVPITKADKDKKRNVDYFTARTNGENGANGSSRNLSCKIYLSSK